MLKTKSIFMLLFLSSLLAQAGGDVVGNGGGLWVCRSSANDVTSAMLVDLYEAKEEFGYSIPQALGSADQILAQRMAVIEKDLPQIIVRLKTSLQGVQSKIHYVDGILQVINDSLYRTSPNPRGCPTGNWNYEQLANYTNLDLVLIQKDLWNNPALPAQDKAGLLMHEAVYKWMRAEFNDLNSVRSRWIVAIFFADLSPSERQAEFEKAMKLNGNPLPVPAPVPPPSVPAFACYLEDQHDSTASIGYGRIEKEAESEALKSCASRSGGNNFFCNSSHIDCEKQQAQENFFCQLINHHDNITTTGVGHSKLEAKYKAMDECILKGQGFFCLSSIADCEEIKP